MGTSKKLLSAVMANQVAEVENLLDSTKSFLFFKKKKPNINQPFDEGLTLLSLAVSKSSVEMTNLLISRGADINLISLDGYSPLHLASLTGNPEIVKILIDKGADLNALDQKGATPLHASALSGHKTVVEILIDAGAKTDIKDNDGLTPELGSKALGYNEIAEILKKKNSSIPDLDKVAEELDANVIDTFSEEEKNVASNPSEIVEEDQRFQKLWELLEEAEKWGKDNNWPVFEEYPQYEKVREIGSQLFKEGGKEKMQATYYIVRDKSFDYSETLNGLWHTCETWLR